MQEIDTTVTVTGEDSNQIHRLALVLLDSQFYPINNKGTHNNDSINQLKSIIRKLISHDYSALLNIYCSRFNKPVIINKILEDLLMTSFEDDILRMKVNSQNDKYLDVYQSLREF